MGLTGPEGPKGAQGGQGAKGTKGAKGDGATKALQKNWKQCTWRSNDGRDYGKIKVIEKQKPYPITATNRDQEGSRPIEIL